MQAPTLGSRVAAVLQEDGGVLLSFVGADPASVPAYTVELREAPHEVRVRLQEENGQQGFRAGAGRRRWARAVLQAPLAGRALVADDGSPMPVARAADLLVVGGPWVLVGYEHSSPGATAAAWRSSFSDSARSLSLTQGGADLLDVDWQRDSFRPVLLGEPLVGGRSGLLYTFSGEQGANHVVAWRTATGAVGLQLMGRAHPEDLVALARSVRSAAAC